VGKILGALLVVGAIVGIGVVVVVANKPKQISLENNTEEKKVEVVEPTEVVKEDEEVVGSGKIVDVTVEASNYKFSPSEVKVKKGDTIKLLFKSSGGIHDFVVDEFEVATNQLNDEEEEEVEFVAEKAGTFEYYCSVGNHRKMGMVGKLVVE
jgi:plastocyanin